MIRLNQIICIAFSLCITVSSCKNDKASAPSPVQQTTLHNPLLTFDVDNALLATKIDTVKNYVNIVVKNTADVKKLKTTFSLASGVNAFIGSNTIKSGDVIDFSKTVTLTIKSTDNKQSVAYTILVVNELFYQGLGFHLDAEKTAEKNYDIYLDQFDSGPFSPINCGPTVITMAMRWSDSTFKLSPKDARQAIKPTGGWWTTADMEYYMRGTGIYNDTYPLTDIESTITQIIDNGDVGILCLDMFYVGLNTANEQHTNKFYNTDGKDWGHFLLVKGYKKVDSKFYLEVNDPYSRGDRYITPDAMGQYKGKSRFYESSGIKQSADIWWPYILVIAPKGKKVTPILSSTGSRLKVNSVIPVASGR
ncbi:hypothetical protein [Mucilaginibacter ginsenosidivorax]|uniref:Peptidase C39-like domain-containing protein n=1 Tax=Mucilaginibacter ginsenosidivorax TaxID=862126 RepID=A0A5B8W9L2_9SPHI|nr:hypothetical protein [Mucilaginibacter ginsenosidivorax]QEC79592.1 hypothetical protein FSB76_27915 [Mucilaginibacter ginsenosidivorax]